MIYLEISEFFSCSHQLLEEWSGSSDDKKKDLIFISRRRIDDVRARESGHLLRIKNAFSWLFFFLKLKPGRLVLLEMKQGKLRLLWLLFLGRLFRIRTGCFISERVNHNDGVARRLAKRTYFIFLNLACDCFLSENGGASTYLLMKGIKKEKIHLFPGLCIEDSDTSSGTHFSDSDQKYVQVFHRKPEILNKVIAILEAEVEQNLIQFYINQQEGEQARGDAIMAYPETDKRKTSPVNFDLSLFFDSENTVDKELIRASFRGERIMVSQTYEEADDFIDPAVNGFIFPDDNARIIAEQIKLSLFHCREDKFLNYQEEIRKPFSSGFKAALLHTLAYE